ncbi:MAG TPA: hypothetical protein VJJ52_01715 [Candidatus Nanoarchaeia archaeon]|nr:hypothetical protein [Candidatus Nanoarchaeia archaeon]
MVTEPQTPTRELTLEEGIEEAMRLIGQVSERPILVAVYGTPLSGIPILFNELTQRYKSLGLTVAGHPKIVYPSLFETVRDSPDALKDLQLMRGWLERPEREEWTKIRELDHLDPNGLAEGIAGKKVHVNIAVYNPVFDDGRPKGDYDIIISNPDLRIKTQYPHPSNILK